MRDMSSELRIIDSALGRHLFVVDGSRIYDIPDDADIAALDGLLDEIVPADRRRIDDAPLAPPPLQSLSLNLAQACNMGCSYCYADEGKFGGRARMMPLDVAKAAVDRLMLEAAPRADLVRRCALRRWQPAVQTRVISSRGRCADREACYADRIGTSPRPGPDPSWTRRW